MEALNMAHSDVPNLPHDAREVLLEVSVQDIRDRGFHQTFPVHPHYTFGFTRSAWQPPLPSGQLVILDR